MIIETKFSINDKVLKRGTTAQGVIIGIIIEMSDKDEVACVRYRVAFRNGTVSWVYMHEDALEKKK